MVNDYAFSAAYWVANDDGKLLCVPTADPSHWAPITTTFAKEENSARNRFTLEEIRFADSPTLSQRNELKIIFNYL